jgi:hypothetical protein
MSEIDRQRRTDAGPKDGHQDVARDRLGDLRLKAAVGLVEMLFPEHRFETDEAFVIAIELRRDGLDPPALRRHVDR